MGFKPRFFSENFRGMRGMKWGTWRGALTGVCRGMKIHSCSALWFTGFESPSKPRTASVARFATLAREVPRLSNAVVHHTVSS